MGSSKVKRVNIQFAITDDLASATASMNAQNAALTKAIADANAAYKNAFSVAAKAEQSRNAAEKVLNSARAAASDLGVAPTSVKGYNEALKMFSTIDATIDKVDDL